jgi:ubiquinone/menaquinone biosynthesis C-methylase UbiE
LTPNCGASPPPLKQSSVARRVTDHFSGSASYWHDVYSRHDVKAQVYRNRQKVVVDWALSVASNADAAAADVGTGAGHLAVALARRGLAVTAIDASEPMINRVAANATRTELTHLVTPTLSDAHSLRLPSSTFDVVTAVGLLPWVEQPGLALAEMARITKPGGHVIATMDNAIGLSRWLDPGWHAPVRRCKAEVRRLLWRHAARASAPCPAAKTVEEFEHLLRMAGLTPIAYRGVGFGPFTVLSRAVIPNRLGLWLDQGLQYLCDRKLPFFRHTAVFHVVLAMKPDVTSQYPASVAPDQS